MAPQKKEKITLTYFNIPGRAEASRTILAYAGVDFVDKRLGRDEFAALKATLPYKQLPLLEIEGYGSLCQSMTIARFLAKKYNLVGHDAFAEAEANEVVDAVNDAATLIYPVYKSTDAAEKKKMLAEVLPKMEAALKNLEARLEARGGQFMAGNTFTWADICMYTMTAHLKMNGAGPAFDGCPKINNLVERVASIPNIKKWREAHQ